MRRGDDGRIEIPLSEMLSISWNHEFFKEHTTPIRPGWVALSREGEQQLMEALQRFAEAGKALLAYGDDEETDHATND